jgi:hypothetical protein
VQVATGFTRTTTFLVPGIHDQGATETGFGANFASPGTWTTVGAVADTGSTLSLMTLTLMALGVAARRFKRAAAQGLAEVASLPSRHYACFAVAVGVAVAVGSSVGVNVAVSQRDLVMYKSPHLVRG